MQYNCSWGRIGSPTAAFVLALVVAVGANADCTKASGQQLKANSGGATLTLLPGGTAEYSAGTSCTVLTFTGIRDGKAFYTDDGLGKGLTILVTGQSFEVSDAQATTRK